MRTYDEETRGILRKILEGQAYRQLMLSNIRGHGLRFLPEVQDKLRVTRALAASLEQFADVERLYALLGMGDVVSAVRQALSEYRLALDSLEACVDDGDWPALQRALERTQALRPVFLEHPV